MVEKRSIFHFNLFNKDKRGISGVVVTLLLILLAIIAVGTVWFIVSSLLSEGAGDISLSGFTLNLDIRNAEKGDNVSVKLRRTGEGDMVGARFIFSDGTSTESINKETVLEELDEKTFYFSIENLNPSDLKTVSVAPFYSTSTGEEKLGGITDTYEFSALGTGGDSSGDTGGDTGGSGGDSGGDTGGDTGGDSGTVVICGDGTVEGNEECEGGASVQCNPAGSANECMCEEGYMPDPSSNGCIPQTPLGSGVVGDTWPAGAVKYFDSEDLPKNSANMSDFIGEYINFSGSETRCLQITYAEYLADPTYNKSYIRLAFTSQISTSDNYQIWTSSNCGG